MNWKVILQLSMFGLAMGLGIVFFLPPAITPALWLIVIALSAYAIAKRCVRLRFWHGLVVGLFDWLLNVATHEMFFHSYAVGHAEAIALLQQVAPRLSVRQLMAEAAPPVGIGLGLMIGLAALLLGAYVDRFGRRDAATAQAAEGFKLL